MSRVTDRNVNPRSVAKWVVQPVGAGVQFPLHVLLLGQTRAQQHADLRSNILVDVNGKCHSLVDLSEATLDLIIQEIFPEASNVSRKRQLGLRTKNIGGVPHP